MSTSNLIQIHNGLCHPGVTRLLHFVRTKNLPFSTEDVKKICSDCRICAELKPRFFHPLNGKLIKATHPMERLSIDFKRPLPSATRNKYLLTLVDEYSRFPFAIPCPDINSSTVIKSLDIIFALCGMPNYIHSDRGKSFMSHKLKNHFYGRGIASSKSTPYHPIGNRQVERYNGIIWKNIKLALHTQSFYSTMGVCTSRCSSLYQIFIVDSNEHYTTFFNFPCRSSHGSCPPLWLTPGPVLLRRFVRSSKTDDLVDEVELVDVNPTYAHD